MNKDTIIPNKLCQLIGRLVGKLPVGIVLLGLLCGCQSGESCHNVVNAKCIECHSTETSCTKIGQSEDWWLRTIDAMVKLGADVSKQERKVLAECLSNPSEANLEIICK
jgi:hypothetical protein